MQNSLLQIFDPFCRRARGPAILAWVLILCGTDVLPCSAQDAENAEARCAVLELFIQNDCKDCPVVVSKLKDFAETRGRAQLHIYNIDEPGKHVDRYRKILKYFKINNAEAPVAYGCNSLLLKLKPDESTDRKLESLLTVNVYVRSGCSRCAAAKVFLAGLKQRYPKFKFVLHDLVSDANAVDKVQELSSRYGKQAVSVPVFHFCNQLMIGWNSEQSTGQALEKKLKYWTTACPQPEKKEADQSSTSILSPSKSQILSFSEVQQPNTETPLFQFVSFSEDDNKVSNNNSTTAPKTEQEPLSPIPSGAPPGGPLPGNPDDDALPPVPGGSSGGPPPPFDRPPPVDGEALPPPESEASDTIEVPLLGELSRSRLGMPAFTFLIGLVDGFNPCAMWVLLFLLSVLVNLRSRTKIVAVAGTFVLISGLAYFAFMAAWLNVFLFIGYLPKVQLTLGIFATLIGLIHIKDFFAFKKGISLSIPEWAKPGLYARVRKIVMAENLTGAIIGASILAVLVNIIELLCTAGLPALYTEVLAMQNYPEWKRYAYLGLYILAYMLDDAIMVTIVVVTLGKHKLQEQQGRWLKLFSGVIILLLGLVLIFKPSLLL